MFFMAAGVGAGIPLGVMMVHDSAEVSIEKIREGYAAASAARLETLNLCLANSGQAVITASDAAKVAGDAAQSASAATKTAAKAVDAAASAVDAVKNK
ncbi:hypothetical protein [Agrobacterium tumefaciens]|uniref:hypothetical protein n=1 Tax=Agrobacterium tumefaciens TaxID=358 RepID=UPI001573AED4|nr:hypothetical protein [Agrobacterium tumefaciens]